MGEPSRDDDELPRSGVFRSRRKRAVGGKTICVSRLPKGELAIGRALYPPEEHQDVERPKTRADCAGGHRPCPWVSCRHHLYLDVWERTGSIKVNFPDLEPDELAETCSLDVADRGPATLEYAAECMNVVRERVRQLEAVGISKLGAAVERRGLRDELAGPDAKRRLRVVR